MSEIKIRPAKLSDIDQIVWVCNQAWENIWDCDPEMFEKRINTFPECGIVVGEVDHEILGYLSMQLVDEGETPPTWNEATDYGTIVSTHKPDGTVLHGVGLAVTAKGCLYGIAGKLIENAYEYAVSNNIRYCKFVARIIGYIRYRESLSPEQYVMLTRRNNKPLDPELKIFSNYGFEVTDPPVVLKDYVEGGGDPRSCGYGVLIKRMNLSWKNPLLSNNEPIV